MATERKINLPPDQSEREIWKRGVAEPDPFLRIKIAQEAVERITERLSNLLKPGVLYLKERELHLNGTNIRLAEEQVGLLVLLGNRPEPAPAEEITERLNLSQAELAINVGRLRRFIEPYKDIQIFLLGNGGNYRFTPRLRIELSQKVSAQEEDHLIFPQEAADKSFLKASLVSDLCRDAPLLEPGRHFVGEGADLRITQRGLVRLRKLSQLRAKNPRMKFNSPQMKSELERIDPETDEERLERELVQLLEKSLSVQEEKNINLLVSTTSQTIKENKRSFRADSRAIASFIYRKDPNKLSRREVARTLMLMPYLRSKFTQAGGSTRFDSDSEIYLFT